MAGTERARAHEHGEPRFDRWRSLARLAASLLALPMLPACHGGEDARCGDGKATGWEQCDGADLRGRGCSSFEGYRGASLACAETCTYDLSACDRLYCGNGAVELDEECDGLLDEEMASTGCQSQGFGSGRLACRSDCRFDTTGCTCEICDNRWDDDEDGLVDCDDPDCAGQGSCPTELCYDGIDNDGNGMTDCEDVACQANAPDCNAGCLSSEAQWVDACGNGLDDDCDALPDAQDPDCLGRLPALVVQGLECGRLQPGDWLQYTLWIYADDGEWSEVVVTLPLSLDFSSVAPGDGGTWDPGTRRVTWHLSSLAHGDGTALHAVALLALAPVYQVCAQATVSASGIQGMRFSADLASPDLEMQTCTRVFDDL